MHAQIQSHLDLARQNYAQKISNGIRALKPYLPYSTHYFIGQNGHIGAPATCGELLRIRKHTCYAQKNDIMEMP